MAGSHPLGTAGATLEHGDHVCFLYLGERARDDVLVPFLETGLRSGDKCICVLDTTDPATLAERLRGTVDVARCLRRRQLELWDAKDACLRSGRFSPDDQTAFWVGLLEEAMGTLGTEGRFGFARIAVEMSWALRRYEGVDQLFAYEALLNLYAPGLPFSCVCMYDLERFGAAMMVGMMKTHPKLLMEGLLLGNPHYDPPDDLLSGG